MVDYDRLKSLGFSQYEIACYLSLAANHPINGSQLSRISGVARSRVYDVLRNLMRKGFVLEVGEGQYVPLPPEELYRRLRLQFDQTLDSFKRHVEGDSPDAAYEYIWVLHGYNNVIARAKQMIATAQHELYVRIFPDSGALLSSDLQAAAMRGVTIRYISMGPIPVKFEIQVVHPESDDLLKSIGGRSFDIIADKTEALVGIFELGQENQSPINWTRNRWFVIANRDSLRHDFYHYFLEKTYERGQTLSDEEKKIYAFIKADN